MEPQNRCPHCGSELIVDDSLLGKPFPCPECHHVIQVNEAPPSSEVTSLRQFLTSQSFILPASIVGGFAFLVCVLLWWKAVLIVFAVGGLTAFGLWQYDKSLKQKMERTSRRLAAEQKRTEQRLRKIRCDNCGLDTPEGSFCGNCGAALPPPSRQELLRRDMDEAAFQARLRAQQLEQASDQKIVRALLSQGKKEVTLQQRLIRTLGFLVLGIGLIAAIAYGIQLSAQRLKEKKAKERQIEKQKQPAAEEPKDDGPQS